MNKIKPCIYFLLIFLMIYLVPTIHARDFLTYFHPYISAKGEYNDNLYLAKQNQKRDFIATITPGIKFDNMDAQSGIILDASGGGVFYNDHSNLNYVSGSVNLNAKYLTRSHFNFYIKNSYLRSDNPREREYFTQTEENKYVLATETTRGVYWRNVVEPTVEYQFGPESRIGATYRNNVYQSAAVGAENSVENYAKPFIIWWINKNHGISLSYAYTNGHFETSPDFNTHKIEAAYLLRFTPRATASLGGAYTKQKFAFEVLGFQVLDYQVYDAYVSLSYIFSPTLSASAQAGYYWMKPDFEYNRSSEGVSFKADVTQKAERTTLNFSLQGGYTQDYFTSQNLGFIKYYRATGSLTHYLHKRFSLGCLGSVERSERELVDMRQTTWGGGVNAAFEPFKWLNIKAEYIYNQRNANYIYNDREYVENKGMLTITAKY